MTINNVYINKIGVFLPNDPVSNDEMEQILGMIDNRSSKARKRILKSNGIESRYYAIDKHTGKRSHSNAQMTAEAIRKLTDERFKLEDINCLVCGTSSPDQLLPSHTVMVHGELRNPSCEIASISGICVSGMQAMKYGYLSVLADQADNAVCCGSELASPSMRGGQFEAEIKSKISELKQKPILAFEKDFLRWMLSDGAGAALLESSPNPNGISLKIEWIDILSFANEFPPCMYQGADKGKDHNLIGYRDFTPEELVTKSVLTLKQDIKLLNENIINTGVKALSMVMKKRKIDIDKIDYFLPHISSEYFREELNKAYQEKGYDIPLTKWFTNLNSVGNVGSASIYLMLEELFHSGKLNKGEKLLLGIPESGRFTMSYALLTVV